MSRGKHRRRERIKIEIRGRSGNPTRPAFTIDGECWLSNGASNGGPYRMADSQPAHRASYSRWHGPIPVGMVIHHLCGNPRCVRPGHLIAISRADHAKMHSRRRSPKK